MARYDAREIKALLDRGENIVNWVQSRERNDQGSTTAILYAYDAQAGSYVEHLKTPGAQALKQNLGRQLGVLLDRIEPDSLLEAGVGEGTSLVPILNHMRMSPARVLGFDISLSRLLFAKDHLRLNGQPDVDLFAAELDRIPLATGSVDVVLTIHAIEPNRGREEAILSELLRVARRALVMIEPSYEMASAEARARMDRLGYVRGLPDALLRMGHPANKIVRWQYNSNPHNEAALIVVDKIFAGTGLEDLLRITGERRGVGQAVGLLVLPEDGHAFPILAGIPCLTIDNAILASKLNLF